MEIWNFLDSVYKYLIAPLGIFFWWLFRKYDQRIEDNVKGLELLRHDVEKLESRLSQEVAVFEVKLDTLKDGIDDIKIQLSKLFDILQKR
jgi:hypothetical protein